MARILGLAGSGVGADLYSRTASAMAIPDLPDNSFREWQRVTDPSGGTGEHGQAWTIRDWQHQGYQRILEGSPSLHIMPVINHLEMCRIPMQFLLRKCSPMPLLFLTVIAASQFASVFYGDTRNAHRGDLSLPSSERFRAVSRSPRRGGYFGQR